MAESAQLPGLAISHSAILNPSRHSLLVRVTHWVTALSFLGLLVSGVAILLAHPRLYWGETGTVGMPSLIDLPLPFVLTGQTGWGRYLHFLCAWVCLFTGATYILSGFVTHHFRKDLLPARRDRNWSALARAVRNHLRLRPSQEEGSREYNLLQRLSYLAVVFLLFPLMIWTGLAMSPAVTSVFPAMVTMLGGEQSARTIHFFDASLLVAFVVVHVAMVSLSGFRTRMLGMITGRTETAPVKERA